MFNYQKDQQERFTPNSVVGKIWEDDFQRITAPLGVIRETNPYSTYDFSYQEVRIELKYRNYSFYDFDSIMITEGKYNKLRKFVGACYFNKFSDGSIYVADLLEINSSLEKKVVTAKTGYTTYNLLIPRSKFTYLENEKAVREYLEFQRSLTEGDIN